MKLYKLITLDKIEIFVIISKPRVNYMYIDYHDCDFLFIILHYST